MKNKFFICLLTGIAIFVTLFATCKKEEKITGITLNINELMLSPGETETLMATIHPHNATNKQVTWTSSNTAIATVSDNGLVAAVDNGKTIITVCTHDGNKTATCSITVDYRAKWTGIYDCVRTFHTYTEAYPSISCDTVVQAVLKVSLKGDSFVHIIDTSTQKFCGHSMYWDYATKILSDGICVQDHGPGLGYYFYDIKFSNDSINVFYHKGPLGFNNMASYKGKKR